ncbi:hypothetical protein [Falsiroseomonas sp. CW058]|uniref:hypothetical protein n=1 Tax=Falsiroseomonas sp. CW058 TaxID=3388664 RepID=UPI003D31606F
MAIPWFLDYLVKRDLERARRTRIRGEDPVRSQIRKDLQGWQGRLRDKLERPSSGQLRCQLLGVLLVGASFAISLLRGIGVLQG